MKKIVSTILSAAMVASPAMPVTIGMSSAAEAAGKKFCKSWAKEKADKNPSKKVVKNMVGLGSAGALVGSALGGKKTTVAGAAIGACSGMVYGGSKWDNYYWSYYDYCRTEM